MTVRRYAGAMEEVLRTNDLALIAHVTALFEGEGIDCFVFDVHMSSLEGSLGILPRRVAVPRQDVFRARALLSALDILPGRP